MPQLVWKETFHRQYAMSSLTEAPSGRDCIEHMELESEVWGREGIANFVT